MIKQAVSCNGFTLSAIMTGNQTTLFLSPPHMSRLAQALVQVMELDCSDQKILEETGIGAGGGTTGK